VRGRPAALASRGRDAVGGTGQIEQVRSFGVVEPECRGDRLEHRGRRAGDGAAFESGVVLDADLGEGGDLAPAQPGHATLPHVGQAGVGRGQLRPA
jgi:hypothetical protein